MNKKELKEELKSRGIKFDEEATNKKLAALLKSSKDQSDATNAEVSVDSTQMNFPETVKTNVPLSDGTAPNIPEEDTESNTSSEEKTEETIQIKKEEWENVQEQLKMLYEVADKGRVFNYENTRAKSKPFKIKLGRFQNGIVIGWRTAKDQLIKHPTTGKTIGEKQEFELELLMPNNDRKKVLIDGYSTFSDARYNERIEVEVVNRKEDWKGNTKYEVKLPDGRSIEIDSRFAN